MTKEALKLALEALVNTDSEPSSKSWKREIEAITAIKEALANEALEKMAENARELGLDYEPEPVPVAVVRWNDIGHISWRTHVMLSDDTPLYTTPPQRTWVGLTDEDFLEACQIAERGNYLVAFQRIQAALKAKNT